MFITMNIIADALKDFEIVSFLTNGSAPIKGIKINEISEDCVSIFEKDGSVFCVFERDSIEVKNAPVDRTLNTILEAARKHELWERDLFHMIFNGCSLQDIVDKAYLMFQNPVFIIDDTDRVLAKTKHKEGTVNEAWDYILKTGYMPFDSANLSFGAISGNLHMRQRRGRNVPFIFSPPTKDIDNRGINYRIFLPGEQEAAGTLVIIENETPVTLGMLNLSEILTGAIDEWMNMHRNDHPFKNVRNLIRELIEDPEQVWNKEVIRRFIVPSPEGYELAVVCGCGTLKESKIAESFGKAIEGSRVYKYGDEFLIVLPLQYEEETIKKKLDEIFYYDGVRVGLSYRFSDLTAIGNYYYQAKAAISYGSGKISSIRPNLAMKYYAGEMSKDFFGVNIAHPALEKLKVYDEQHGGELYLTLYQFLRNERSLVDSAKALNIHRNSLIYRIEKILRMTGLDLDDPDIREYLLFSYRMTMQP